VAKFPTLQDIRSGTFDDYACRINVSDLYRPEIDDALLQTGVKTFWFPQGEAFGMSLASLYGALRIMWEAEKHNQALLLHCHSGRNRSVMVADCYFFLRTEKHLVVLI
jgi:protein-tyrosine phosphatase